MKLCKKHYDQFPPNKNDRMCRNKINCWICLSAIQFRIYKIESRIKALELRQDQMFNQDLR